MTHSERDLLSDIASCVHQSPDCDVAGFKGSYSRKQGYCHVGLDNCACTAITGGDGEYITPKSGVRWLYVYMFTIRQRMRRSESL